MKFLHDFKFLFYFTRLSMTHYYYHSECIRCNTLAIESPVWGLLRSLDIHDVSSSLAVQRIRWKRRMGSTIGAVRGRRTLQDTLLSDQHGANNKRRVVKRERNWNNEKGTKLMTNECLIKGRDGFFIRTEV